MELKEKIMKYMEEYYAMEQAYSVVDILENPEAVTEEVNARALNWLVDYHKGKYEAAKNGLMLSLALVMRGGSKIQAAELGCALDDYNNDGASDSMEGTEKLLAVIFDSLCFIEPVEWDGTDKPYYEFLKMFISAVSN